MKTTVFLSAAAAALVAGPAMANYDLAFDVTGPGHADPGSIPAVYTVDMFGALDALDFAVDFTNEGGWTWAGDLHVSVVDPNGGSFQFGGYDHDSGHPGAGDFPSSWDTSTSGSFSHNISVAAAGLSGSGTWTITFTDGYSNGAATDNWSGVLGLEGLDAVPAPGALALLGLAGLAGRRRRR